MKHQATAKSRKELKHKMEAVFSEKIQTLSPDLQDVLLDDLVTAFENRLSVLNRARLNMQCLALITEGVECETI
jgi:hypothetical protein